MTTFAHITDLHLSEQAESPSSDRLVEMTLALFNSMQALDFVLVSGDVLDIATQTELERFLRLMDTLEKPWHFVPGNHDGYYDPNVPQAFAPHEAVTQINHPPVPRTPDAQYAYWSTEPAPGVCLIGLDSRYADHWNGKIEGHQREWLRTQLAAYADHTIIVMVHHPLVALYPVNSEEFFENFIVDDGHEVAALLSEWPAVKVLVHGHHHTNRLIEMDGWLHIGTAPLTRYPFSYRIITVAGDRVRVRTETIADNATMIAGREAAHTSTTANKYNSDNPAEWLDISKGTAADLSYEGVV